LNNGERLTSDEFLHKLSFESIRGPVLIAPPSTPVLDKRVSYFAAVTMEHPGTLLAEYDCEKTSVMHKLEINDLPQEDPSGDGEARPSTASSVIDLNGLPDERPWTPSKIGLRAPSILRTPHTERSPSKRTISELG
jgi:hypothetical protein